MFKGASEKIFRFFEQPVNKAIDKVAGFFAGIDQLSAEDMEILALVKAVLPTDQTGMEKALIRFRSSLEKQNIDDRKINSLLDFLRQVAPGTPERALPILKTFEQPRRREVVANLLQLAITKEEYRDGTLELIRKLALELDISEEEFEQLAESIRIASASRSRIIRSGTGIVLALIVIGLFVLIATWLSSLLFGLALAYIFLPLEQHFERRLRRPPGRIRCFFQRIMPLGFIRKQLKKQEKFQLSEEELQRREAQALTTKAVTLTVSCVVVGFVVLLVGLLILLSSYVSALGDNWQKVVTKVSTPAAAVQTTPAADGKNNIVPVEKSGENKSVKTVPAEKAAVVAPSTPAQQGVWAGFKNWSRKYVWGKKMFPEPVAEVKPAAVSPVEKTVNNISERLLVVLDNLKQRFQKLPLVQSILDELGKYLKDGKAEKKISELLLKKSGGLFAFLAKFVAAFATFLLNLLMTFFFFSLLLSKLAAFVNASSNQDKPAASYLIRTVFNGKWLPLMSEENLRDGDRIVCEVINKLRIWLRGYMTMVFIDFCVYSTVFTLLKVPYALLLGAVAAVGILLPYIGPVSSALLTVLVTLAVGGADVSVLQICGIIGIYLLHNGIIEQFFIYPAIIGESLGLTTLETIIVVLLGGIIAGIPGMIFALPTASVIKYLVPQIYRCWR